ncbi:MAG: hypothetical protein M0P66_09545 [Salinivirgaceae bacterium]|nr:hypothetical protein [Salinivirgaceae bacterium]
MIFETFGTVMKEENVKTIEHGILPNTFVLENLGMFPGYYGTHFPTQKVPDSIFLVLSQKVSTEKILRVTHDIKRKTKFEFEGTPASLTIYNNVYFSIRLRYLQSLNHLIEIQEHYRDAGFVFAKMKKLNETAVIHIKKVFHIESLTEKVLKDSEKDMYYLKIDEQLTWSHFKKLIAQVRNNVKLPAFDGALAVVYGTKVFDLIRIYSTGMNTEQLELLHDKVEELIAKSLED